MARRSASGTATVVRIVHGARLNVAADDPELLAAALAELPGRSVGPDGAGKEITLQLSRTGVLPSPPSPLRRRAGPLRYLERYPEVWLRADDGAVFHAHLGCRHATVRARTSGCPWGAGLSAGLGLLLSHLLREVGLYPVHAASVACGADAVLLAGRSGSGKSTTAAVLAGAGFHLLGDDLTLLRPRGGAVDALSFPRPVRLRPDTAEWLPAAAAVRAQSEQGDSPLWAADTPAVPRLLLFPSVRARGASEVRPLSGTETLGRLIGCSLLPGGTGVVALHGGALARAARGARGYRLLLGRDVERLPGLVHTLLAECAS